MPLLFVMLMLWGCGPAWASLTVTSPNGGEGFPLSGTPDVTWTFTEDHGPLDIDLFRGTPPNGTYIARIATETECDGLFAWTVDTVLAPASDYFIKIWATSAIDIFDYSDATFTINPGVKLEYLQGGIQIPPGVPVSFTWRNYPDAAAVGPVVLDLYRGAAPHGVFQGHIPSDGSSQPNTGSYTWQQPCVPAGNDYYLRIAGETDGLPEDFSDTAFGVMAVQLPAAPTTCSAQDGACNGITVSWTDNSSNESAFRIYRNSVRIDSVTANTTTYVDHPPNTGSYSYRVRAAHACGGESASSNSDLGSLLPSAGTCAITLVRDTCTAVFLRWSATTGIADEYHVYRDDTLARIVSADTTDYAAVIAASAGEHTFTVRPFNATCGEGEASAPVVGTSRARAGIPTNLATASYCDSVVLTWSLPWGTTEGWIIRRDAMIIDTADALADRYADATVPNAINHTYTLQGWNSICYTDAQSSPVMGRLSALVALEGSQPDSVYGLSYFPLDLSYCENVDSVQFCLSVEYSPYLLLRSGLPLAVDSVLMPDTVGNPCRVKVIAFHNGRADSATTEAFEIQRRPVAADPVEWLSPGEFTLEQNYPNPFNPTTTIRFHIPQTADVRLRVFDLLGREMATLVSGTLPPGLHSVAWDCAECAAGMYVIRFESGTQVLMRKMLLMK